MSEGVVWEKRSKWRPESTCAFSSFVASFAPFPLTFEGDVIVSLPLYRVGLAGLGWEVRPSLL